MFLTCNLVLMGVVFHEWSSPQQKRVGCQVNDRLSVFYVLVLCGYRSIPSTQICHSLIFWKVSAVCLCLQHVVIGHMRDCTDGLPWDIGKCSALCRLCRAHYISQQSTCISASHIERVPSNSRWYLAHTWSSAGVQHHLCTVASQPPPQTQHARSDLSAGLRELHSACFKETRLLRPKIWLYHMPFREFCLGT